jgi:hypothetical protein
MNFIFLSLFILLIPVLMCYTIIGLHEAFGQTIPYTPPQIQYQPVEVKPAGQNDYVAMIMPLIVGAGGVILAKFAKDTNDKVKKVETTTKENAAAIVDSKAVEKELARLMFEWNKEKAEALDNSPETKLQTLDEQKKKAVDTASKA